MPEVGDRVAVASNKMGTPPREGIVRAVSGRMVSIEWSNGGQTMLTAAPGSIQVLGRSRARKAAPAKAAGAKKASAPAIRKVSPAKKAVPAKKAGARTNKTSPARPAAAKKATTAAKKAPTKTAPAKKAPSRAVTVKKAPAKKAAKGAAKKR
jgi:hypothetical protein